MANILVHALAATAGGGANYLRNFLARLGDAGAGHAWHVLVPAEFEAVPPAANVRIVRGKSGRGAVRRIWHDQIFLRREIARRGIDLILATGNFGMLRPPVPQALLSRNALYFSREHLLELRRRGAMRELLNTVMRRRLALASIADSAVNIVPTDAFRQDIRAALPRLPGDRFAAVPHGFDHEKFLRPDAPFAPGLAAKLKNEPGVRRILMVSHYNYFRNFETLIDGFAALRRAAPYPVELILTTTLGEGVKDHRYDTTEAWRKLRGLGVADRTTMLGTVPHGELHALYRTADVAVCPSYAESFGHPMVEAMASGRPIVASDRATQREMCGDAALYFPTFDGATLAARLRRVLDDADLAKRLGAAGRRRAADFTWERHFDELLGVLAGVLERRRAAA